VAPASVSPLREPAKSILKPGDRIVSVNGVSGGPRALQAAVNSHRCAGRLVQGCAAAVPIRVVVDRRGVRRVFSVRPRYDRGAGRMLIGFSLDSRHRSVGPVSAARLSVTSMWDVTTKTVSIIGRIFVPKERKQLHSVVGSYQVTQESFATSTSLAFQILALISLSLAIVNLFPFLPLDGGHIFWAVAEKVRGRAIPFSVMERASVVGFALVLMVFVIGLTNDIHDLTNGGLQVR
jgi:regulator of sigma E protease